MIPNNQLFCIGTFELSDRLTRFWDYQPFLFVLTYRDEIVYYDENVY